MDGFLNFEKAANESYQRANPELTSRTRIAINEIRNNDKVLEIGVGFGEMTKNISVHKSGIKLYAVDIVESALKDLSSHLIDSQVADISNQSMKFRDDEFDTVICLEVFEHLQNPYHALSEIQRVLKPGGKLVLSVPNYLGGHIMIYPGLITPKFFKLFLRQNFFKVVNFYVWGPVWNRDNVGEILFAKIKNRFVAILFLRIVQVAIRCI